MMNKYKATFERINMKRFLPPGEEPRQKTRTVKALDYELAFLGALQRTSHKWQLINLEIL